MGTQIPLTDQSLMPYGKHEGTPMENVPADYLIWLLDNNKCTFTVRAYIEDNLDGLREEIEDDDFNYISP